MDSKKNALGGGTPVVKLEVDDHSPYSGVRGANHAACNGVHEKATNGVLKRNNPQTPTAKKVGGEIVMNKENKRADEEGVAKDLPVRQGVSDSQVEKWLSSARYESEPSGRWTAKHSDLPGFSAQGRSEEECKRNASTNLRWFLERRNAPK